MERTETQPRRGLIAGVVALTAVIGLAASTPPRAVADETLDARTLLDAVDDIYRGQQAYAEIEMSVKTEHWSRTLRIESWSHGTDKSLMRILSPRKEKGTSTLRSGKDIWNYLPKVKRVIKLPSSMMSSSWMGSHFTNDDLVKESRFTEDFDFKISFRGKRDGKDVIDISCLPKRNAAVVWGKVVVTVLADGYMPVKSLYYDEDMKLARTMTFSGIKQFGTRKLPSVMLIVPADKPKESTRVRYLKLDFDRDIPDSTFSLRALRR